MKSATVESLVNPISTCKDATNNIKDCDASSQFSLTKENGFSKNHAPAAVNVQRHKTANSWTKQDVNYRLTEAINKAPVALLTIDGDGQILAANSACKSIMGIPATVLAGTILFEYLCSESAESLKNELIRYRDGAITLSNDLSLSLSHPLIEERPMQVLITNSEPATDDDHQEFVIVLLNRSRQQQIENQLRDAKDYLERLATHDALTGLPNRIFFTDALRAAMFNARKAKRQLALLYFDIDGFKGVNDQYGHHVGDALLREIANRLRIRTREVGRLARLGGDEFTLILEHTGTQDSLLREAEIVRLAISEPFQASSTTLTVSASIGIAIYPDFAKTPRHLIQYADTAMYQAKRLGGNCVVQFSSEHQEKLIRTKTLESDFSASIGRSEFILNFQPIVDCNTDKIDTLEVLVRWNHPEYGIIAPDEFIPMAERTGLINELGNWIIENACEACRRLHNSGNTVRFAINISPIQLNNKNLANDILSCLQRYNLQPEWFDLEITESCIMSDIDCALTQIEELGKSGFSIAVDDFGTGHSSLARLSSLPVSKIKLDRLFTSGLTKNADSKIIVKGLIGIAHELGMSVVAEGVENQHQTELLQGYRCEYIQGYGVYRPQSEEGLPSILAN